MFNQYIPQGDYEPVPAEKQGFGFQLPGLDGILKLLRLDRFDSGDILLILVLIFLYKDKNDEDWLIVLALVVLMGL